MRAQLRHMSWIQRQLLLSGPVKSHRARWRSSQTVDVGVVERAIREYELSYVLAGDEKSRWCGALPTAKGSIPGEEEVSTAPWPRIYFPRGVTTASSVLCRCVVAAPRGVGQDVQPGLTFCAAPGCGGAVLKTASPIQPSLPCDSLRRCGLLAVRRCVAWLTPVCASPACLGCIEMTRGQQRGCHKCMFAYVVCGTRARMMELVLTADPPRPLNEQEHLAVPAEGRIRIPRFLRLAFL